MTLLTDNLEYYRAELDQIIERISSLENSRIQLGVFCGTANLTVLGFAASEEKVGILLAATGIMLVFMIAERHLRSLYRAYYYRGLQLQRKFAPSDTETFLQILPSHLADEVIRIASIQDDGRRRIELKTVNTPFRSTYFRLSLIVFVTELLVGLVLWWQFNWRLI